MQPNGASRCPICHQEPLSYTDSLHDELIIIECPPHGLVALGRTPNQAVRNWNKLVNQQKLRNIPHTIAQLSQINQNICPYCQKETTGQTHYLPERAYVECNNCHMIKRERTENGGTCDKLSNGQ